MSRILNICLQSNGAVHSVMAHTGTAFLFTSPKGEAFLKLKDTVANPVQLDVGGFVDADMVFPVANIPYVEIPTLSDASSPIDYSNLGNSKPEVIKSLFDRYLNA